MELKKINDIGEFKDFEYKHKINPFIVGARDLRFFKIKDSEINFELFVREDLEFVSFNNCTFNEPINFSNLNITKSFDFINCVFNNKVNFKNIKINGKSRFWESSFNFETKFNNISFKDLADFFKVIFIKKIIFYKVDFFGTTVFTESSFRENVLFTYTKITDVILFTRTQFEEGLDLSLAIITGQIITFDSKLKKFPDKIDIKNNDDYRNAVETLGIIPRSNKKETYRILKKHSKTADNQFLFLEYSKLENEVHFKQLKVFNRTSFDTFFIFFLNKISNDHNMSWSRGVGFTAIVGLTFFYSAMLSTSCIEFSWIVPPINKLYYFLDKYILFLSPIHTMEIYKYENSGIGTSILDFLGRIFVSYGIYQTIQAFRKHKG